MYTVKFEIHFTHHDWENEETKTITVERNYPHFLRGGVRMTKDMMIDLLCYEFGQEEVTVWSLEKIVCIYLKNHTR